MAIAQLALAQFHDRRPDEALIVRCTAGVAAASELPGSATPAASDPDGKLIVRRRV